MLKRWSGGQTPLHYANDGSHIELVNLLIEANAEVNVVNRQGKTPLDKAFHKEIGKLLLAAGARTNKHHENEENTANESNIGL